MNKDWQDERQRILKDLRDKFGKGFNWNPSSPRLADYIQDNFISKSELKEVVEGMIIKNPNCYCDGSGKSVNGFCNCEFSANQALTDLLTKLEKEE